MLGSDKAGERASAAKAATEFMRKHKLSWRELIDGQAAPAQRKGVRRVREVGGVDYLEAAESRVRQLQTHNTRLERQIRLLKDKLDGQ